MEEETKGTTGETERAGEEYEWTQVRVRKDVHSKIEKARTNMMKFVSENPTWRPELVGTRLSMSDAIQYLCDEYERMKALVLVLERKARRR